MPDQVTIPAGQSSVDIPLVPVDDNRREDRREAILEALYGDGYRLVSYSPLDNQATVYLFDTQETVSITATRPTAIRDPLQDGGFRLTRTGALDGPLTVFLRPHEVSSPVSL